MLKCDIEDATGTIVCSKTVRRRLASWFDWLCIASCRKSTSHKKKHLDWCRERINWTIEQRKKVLWSDESMFELFPSRRVWVRRKNERYHPVGLYNGVGTLKVVKGPKYCIIRAANMLHPQTRWTEVMW